MLAAPANEGVFYFRKITEVVQVSSFELGWGWLGHILITSVQAWVRELLVELPF